MKKYLLLPLVALGLITWAPNQAKAGVHVTFGFGGPAYLATVIITTRIGITGIPTTTTVIGIVGSIVEFTRVEATPEEANFSGVCAGSEFVRVFERIEEIRWNAFCSSESLIGPC